MSTSIYFLLTLYLPGFSLLPVYLELILFFCSSLFSITIVLKFKE